MASKLCALFIGMIYLFFGISGLFPGFVHLPPTRLLYDQMHIVGSWGYLYSWLPVNLVHDILYIAIGSAGILAAVTFSTSVAYCRGMLWLALLLMFLGMMPFGIAQVWGLLPLFAWNVMVHAITAVLVYYYGYVYPLDFGGGGRFLHDEDRR
jgi:hypothetical protein